MLHFQYLAFILALTAVHGEEAAHDDVQAKQDNAAADEKHTEESTAQTTDAPKKSEDEGAVGEKDKDDSTEHEAGDGEGQADETTDDSTDAAAGENEKRAEESTDDSTDAEADENEKRADESTDDSKDTAAEEQEKRADESTDDSTDTAADEKEKSSNESTDGNTDGWIAKTSDNGHDNAEEAKKQDATEVQTFHAAQQAEAAHEPTLAVLPLIAALLSFSGVAAYVMVFVFKLFGRKKGSKSIPGKQSCDDLDFEDIEVAAVATPSTASSTPVVRKSVHSQEEVQASANGWDNDLLGDGGWEDSAWDDDNWDDVEEGERKADQSKDCNDLCVEAHMKPVLMKGKAD